MLTSSVPHSEKQTQTPARLQTRSVKPKSKEENVLEQKVDSFTVGFTPFFRKSFQSILSMNLKNTQILLTFLEKEKNEDNVKQSTLCNHLNMIYLFCKFTNYKDFDKVTKDDVVSFLSSVRKTEDEDPSHKWINTYNNRYMVLSKFFRWLYNKDEYDKEKWISPQCLHGTKRIKRKEKSSYKPSDIWTNEEHSLFLKYCPDKRDRCYHAVAGDTSCRPHELLSLKIEDIKFKMSSTGTQYAEVHISQSKTKPRTIPLIFSVPYVKEWIDNHPLAGNPKAFLFCTLSDRCYGKRLSVAGLYANYKNKYKQKYFSDLVKDKSISERDKAFLKNLLTKPWNPYIIRHSALTAKSQILKESVLRDHASWTATSNMPNIYIHYFGNESSKSLLEAYGIEDFSKEQTQMLKAKQCPNCNEPNRPDSKFCMKCRMVLSYDAYAETLEEQKAKEDLIHKLEEKYMKEMEKMRSDIESKLAQIVERIDLSRD